MFFSSKIVGEDFDKSTRLNWKFKSSQKKEIISIQLCDMLYMIVS